jgi:hypothetical protein
MIVYAYQNKNVEMLQFKLIVSAYISIYFELGGLICMETTSIHINPPSSKYIEIYTGRNICN